jgi:hypothetical protein
MSMWHVAMSMCMHISHMHICISHMCMPIRFIAFNHVHVHVHAHMCMHIKPYASVMIRACTYVRVHVHVHVHVHVYVLCMCMCMRCALHVHVHARGKVRKDSMLPHLGERLNVDSLPVIATHGVCLAVAPRHRRARLFFATGAGFSAAARSKCFAASLSSTAERGPDSQAPHIPPNTSARIILGRCARAFR